MRERNPWFRDGVLYDTLVGFKRWHAYGLLFAGLFCGFVLALVCIGLAHADPGDSDGPSKTNDVCTAYNLGVPENQIPGLLRKNDGRENYNKSWNDTVWPIIEGDCG